MNKITYYSGKKKIISLLIAAVMLAALIMPLTVSAAILTVTVSVPTPYAQFEAGAEFIVTAHVKDHVGDVVDATVTCSGTSLSTIESMAHQTNGDYTGKVKFADSTSAGQYTITITATNNSGGNTGTGTVVVEVTALSKESTPALGTGKDFTIDYTTETLTFIGTKTYLVGSSEYQINNTLQLTNRMGTTLSIVAKGAAGSMLNSDPWTLALTRQSTPSSSDYTVNEDGTITFKNSIQYEWSNSLTGIYSDVTNNASLQSKTWYLRKKAISNADGSGSFASDSAIVSPITPPTSTKETKPNAYIDYSRTEIYNLVAGATYTINGSSRNADASGRISISAFLNSYSQRWDYTYGGYAYDLNIIKKGNGTTTIDSDPQYLIYHTNQGYGYAHLSASNETGQGRNDGYIYGMLSTYTYEYKFSSESEYAYRTLSRSSSNSSRSVNLSPGTYNVRINYYNNYANYVQTLTIYPYGTTGWATVSVPTFSSEYYGYAYRPSAKSLTIYNPSSETAYITSVNVSGYAFDIYYGSYSSISAGSSLSSYTIQPRTGLSSGTYSETVTVTYRIGSSSILYTASAQVYFTVIGNSYEYDDYSYYYETAKRNSVVDSTTRSGGNVSGVLSYYNKAEKNGDVNISVTTEAITGAVDRMRNERSRNGKSSDSLALTLNFTTSGGYSPKATIELTSGALRELVSYGVSLTIITDTGSVTFPSGAVRTINSSSSAGCVIKIFKDSKLSTSVSSLVGNRPAVEFKVYGIKNGKMNEVKSFGAQLTLSINYSPGSNEKTGNLGIYKIVGGKAARMSKSYYASGVMEWTGNTLSLYAVGYERPATEFADTIGHWAKSSIDFVSSRGILAGTSDGVFSPDTDITRGMFITALGRISGENVSSYKSGKNFSDVDNGSIYHTYIEWAYANNIITRDDGKFEPNRAITREEMAAMLYKYAAYAKYSIPSSVSAVAFQDAENISPNAKDAVKAMQTSGIIQGKGEDVFDPQGETTRAEASAVLQRFVVSVIDASPERGWVQESANGAWQYINAKGETVKGWQEISGSSYYFGNNGYMAIGWQTVKGEKYYFDDNGVMAKSKWVKIGDGWYYFYSDGRLAVDTAVDGYKVDSNGVRE